MQDAEFLRMRGVERDLRRLGFFLDEQLPDPRQMARCDLSTVVWLQIAEEVGDRLIVLNLDEFNNLVTRVLAEQYGSLSRVLQLKRISAEKLKEVAHVIVRDPTGVFRPMVQQHAPSVSLQTTSIAQAPAPEQPSLRAPATQFGMQPPTPENLYWFNSGMLAAAASGKLGGSQKPEQPSQPQHLRRLRI